MNQSDIRHMNNCSQPDRDTELLQKHAEKFAVTILTNLPADYPSRKRIITNGILAALQSVLPPMCECGHAMELHEAVECLAESADEETCQCKKFAMKVGHSRLPSTSNA
jgi:hypothetical protein